MTTPTFTPTLYPAPAPSYAGTHATRRSFGPSAVVAVAGAAALGTAFTVLPWFRKDYNSVGGGGTKATFHDIHTTLDGIQGKLAHSPFRSLIDLGFSPSYFSWLGWALLALAVVGAAAAVSPLGSGAVRAAGATIAAAGFALTAWNLQLFTVNSSLAGRSSQVPDGYLDWLEHSSFGAWAALAGFLLLATAAAIGPRRG